eukprot:gene36709-47853_t
MGSEVWRAVLGLQAELLPVAEGAQSALPSGPADRPYGNKAPTAILPVDEKIHPHYDDDDCATIRGSVVTIPVMDSGVVPKNQLNNTLNDTSATKTSSALWFLTTASDVGSCAGACQSSVCAAGSCGTSGCGGTCG